jgi:cation diffusion facilitator CzcD-associated flavoprotein CzcO
LKPWFGVEVLRARRVEEEWRVETNKGEWRAPNLVMATGFNRIPHRPRFSGQTQFRGPILHSCDYRNGAPFHGQRVAVIGSGNSGAEIAVDLHEHGAETKLVVRSPVHIAARTFMGLHAQKSSISLTRLPNRVANAIMGAASSLAFGDLSAYGLRRPAMGAMTQIKTVGRIPIIDAGLVAKVKAGDVGIVPGIESFGTRSINFVDGRELPFDAVIMATGYRTGLQLLLDQSALYTDPAGRPLAHGAEVANAGIFFLGYANPPTGTLREISLEAPPIANAIWSRLQERRQASNTVEALNWHPSCL